MNSIEAFPLFAVGVLMAHTTQTYGFLIDILAVTFVVSRVLYMLFYWWDLHWQRSLQKCAIGAAHAPSDPCFATGILPVPPPIGNNSAL